LNERLYVPAFITPGQELIAKETQHFQGQEDFFSSMGVGTEILKKDREGGVGGNDHNYL